MDIIATFHSKCASKLIDYITEKGIKIVNDKKLKKLIENFAKQQFDIKFKNISFKEEFDFKRFEDYILKENFENIVLYYIGISNIPRELSKDILIEKAYIECNAKTNESQKCIYYLIDNIYNIIEEFYTKKIDSKDIFVYNSIISNLKILNENINSNIEKLEESILNKLEKNAKDIMHNENYKNSFASIIDKISPKQNIDNKFHYLYPKMDFYGRDNEFAFLDRFKSSPENILFTAVTGVGGIGKSKLIFKYIKEHETDLSWKNVYPNNDDIDKFNTKEDFSYYKNLFIVIDYVGEIADKIGILLKNILHYNTNTNKIRIILIERQSVTIDNMGNIIMPYWYNTLLNCPYEYEYKEKIKNILYKDSKIKTSFLELKALEKKDYKNIIVNYILNNSKQKNINDKEINFIIKTHKKIDIKSRRPLFLLFIIDAWIKNPTKNTWEADNVMKFIYERFVKNVKNVCKIYENDYEDLQYMLIYATATKNWNIEKDVKSQVFNNNANNLKNNDFDKLNNLLCDINNTDKYKNELTAIEPDLIGEIYFLEFIRQKCLRKEHLKIIINDLWEEGQINFAMLLLKIINDFNNINYLRYKNFFVDFCVLFKPQNKTNIRNYSILIANIYATYPDITEKERILGELRQLHTDSDIPDVAVKYAECLFNMCNTYPDITEKERILGELRQLHATYPDIFDVVFTFAECLSNMCNTYPDITEKERILGELRQLHTDSDIPDVAIIFAECLFNMYIDCPDIIEKDRMLDELRQLHMAHLGISDADIEYAECLFNMCNTNPDIIEEERMLGELRKLHTKHPDIFDVAIEYAECLFNMCNIHPDITEKERILGELRQLHTDSDIPDVAIIFAECLFNMCNTYPDITEKECILGELRQLHTDSDIPDVAVKYAKCLFNMCNTYPDITEKERILGELRQLHATYPDIFDVAIIFAKCLFNMYIDCPDITEKERILGELRQLHTVHLGISDVAIIFAECLSNMCNTYPDITEKERILGELRQLHMAHPDIFDVVFTFAGGLAIMYNTYTDVDKKQKILNELSRVLSRF